MIQNKILYYPFINLKNPNWLKKAFLFWDEIYTIVPRQENSYYTDDVSKAFSDYGILRPRLIDSSSPLLSDIEDMALDYLTAPEALLTWAPRTGRQNNDSDSETISINTDKLSYNLKENLRSMSNYGDNDSRPDYLRTDPRFAAFYMTLLASKISDTDGLALVSDFPDTYKFLDRVRLDNFFPLSDPHWHFHPGRFRRHFEHERRHWEVEICNGVLSHIAVQYLQVHPSTPPSDLFSFKERYADEIVRYRQALSAIIDRISLPESISENDLREVTQKMYEKDVLGSLNDLKAAMKSSRINFGLEMIAASAFTSGVSFIPSISPLALLGAIGISVSLVGIRYNSARKEILRNNPISFLLGKEAYFAKGQ